MGSHRSLCKTIRALLLLCCLLLASTSSVAKLVARRDFHNGILDAELVVIVLQQSPDSFRIEEVFLGNTQKGDSIELPGFRLFTQQQYGPDIIDPITADTRILLFLRHKKDAPAAWEATHFGYSFFWVQNPQEVTQLRTTAEEAVTLRRRWEEAASISDPRRRVEALWQFLSMKDYGSDFLEHTKSALQSIAPASGDYFAEKFADMPHWNRADLFKDAGAYGGDKLHQTLANYIRSQQQLYETSVSTYRLEDHDVRARWKAIPDEVKEIPGDIYYGLAGLASFQRRDDLPVIRKIALWAVKYNLEQTSEAALNAFRTMPDENNLPVISLIWKEFPLGSGEGDEIFHIDVIQTLCAHKYPQTVPLLAPFVTDGFAGAEAQAALSEIVGRDLGQKPKPWLDWYRTLNSAPQKRITIRTEPDQNYDSAAHASDSLAQLSSSTQGTPDAKQAELETSAHVFFLEGAELDELISKAKSGDAEAQYWVGIKCEERQLETMDSREAEQWILKSAEQGFAPAQRKYGLMLARTNPPVGEGWLLRAAEQGDAEAQMWLGAAYEQNWFGTTDVQESLKWYRRAAQGGQVDAQMLLGNRYEMGHGVEQNYARAADWYRKASEQVLPLSPGVSEARYHLALLYLEGHGVPQDYAQAYFWLRLVGPEEHVNKAKVHMTPAQIREGEELVKQWKGHHRLKPEIAAAFKIEDEP